MMALTDNDDSHNIMHFIKEGSVGAEIGVWMGSSSKQFIKRNPKKLYLVDPWAVTGYQPAIDAGDETFSEETYYNKYSKITGGADKGTFTKYYDDIAEKVNKEYGKLPNVEICRMNSTDWFDQFDAPFLDWIYIDGDHSYTGAYSDFCNALKVVKTGGVIIGDDYKWGRDGDKGGVKKAVNKWASDNFLTLEKYGNNQVVIRL
jgi:hypothetical protein